MSIWTHERHLRVDWWVLVTDLMRAGISQREIGRRCMLDHGGINKLRNQGNCQPLLASGIRLIALWMQVLGKTEHEIPQLTAAFPEAPRVDPRQLHLPLSGGEDIHHGFAPASARTD